MLFQINKKLPLIETKLCFTKRESSRGFLRYCYCQSISKFWKAPGESLSIVATWRIPSFLIKFLKDNFQTFNLCFTGISPKAFTFYPVSTIYDNYPWTENFCKNIFRTFARKNYENINFDDKKAPLLIIRATKI